MWSFDPRDYGPAVAPLLDISDPQPLGPGSSRQSVRETLQGLTEDRLLAGRPVRDRQMAACCLSGLWLLHNYLDESHSISQKVGTPSGSYWHGIMHRREPDYSNAKYWFRRVGEHPVFVRLGPQARRLAGDGSPHTSRFLRDGNKWDPAGFVDFCQMAAGGDEATAPLARQIARLARQMAQLEWEMLFDYCYREAAGSDDFPPGAGHDR